MLLTIFRCDLLNSHTLAVGIYKISIIFQGQLNYCMEFMFLLYILSGRLFKNGKMVRSRHFEESEDEQIEIFDIKVCRFSLPYGD